MALNINDAEIERLVAELERMTHETKAEVIRRALLDTCARLRATSGVRVKRKSLREYLERKVWPLIPATELGRVLARDEEARILGYGPEGY